MLHKTLYIVALGGEGEVHYCFQPSHWRKALGVQKAGEAPFHLSQRRYIRKKICQESYHVGVDKAFIGCLMIEWVNLNI